ncbi:type II toxin-antitoxin system RelE/ParE family toxin [Paenibacillus sp. FSL R10-2782]|uniref:type II toxin-antitoxin system RelE/ParE family toxin n=1 Tax=Paenibacillus sp. FSL R10-2782 TaxID=2954661 RepID=UPI003158E79C
MAEIINYATPKGKSEVEEAILQLSEKAEKGNKQATRELDDILYTLERYEDGMPHSRQLRGRLYELRPGRYRILYFRWQGKLVLLTMFRKSTQQTPVHEIERAESRMKDWLNLYKE